MAESDFVSSLGLATILAGEYEEFRGWLYAIGGLLLGAFLFWVFRPVPMERPWRVKSRPLLTPNELDFCQRLEAALPEYRVLSQVSMGALMEPDLADERSPEPGRFLSIRGRFAQKVVDFVVVDEVYQVIALVELDDSTHDPEKDVERDRITEMAGYLTIRYDSRQKPLPEEIRDDFAREGLLQHSR